MGEIEMRLSDREAEMGEAGEILDKQGKLDTERFLEKFWKEHKAATVIGGLGVLLLAVGMLSSLIFSSAQSSQVEIISPEEAREERKVFIDVAGAVEKPGVYQLDGQARVADALVAAGGLSASADRAWVAKNLNLASKIKDGSKIYVKFFEEKPASFVSEVAGIAVAGDRININTASVSQLDRLPGIGPTLAQRIIDYRSQNGSYSNIEDLLKVSGIGQKLFSRVKDKVIVW